MHLFQGHRTSSEPLWHVGLPPLFTQAYIHSLHRFLAHFMICDDYFMISSGFPLWAIWAIWAMALVWAMSYGLSDIKY